MSELIQEDVQVNNVTKRKSSSVSGNKCYLPHCRRSKRNDPNMRIFRFPYTDHILLNIWMEKCKLNTYFLEKSPTLYLCDKHFSSEYMGKRFLKRRAIPTLNLTDKTLPSKSISWPESTDPTQSTALLSTAVKEVFISLPQSTALPGNEDEFIDLQQHAALQQDIEVKEEFISLTQSTANVLPLCNICRNKIEDEEPFYQKEYFKIRDKYKAAKKELYSLKSKNLSLKKRLEGKATAVAIKSIESEVDKLNISTNEKAFCRMLMKKERGSTVRWDEHEKHIASDIFYKSPSAYIYLRNKLKFNLPAPGSLSKSKNEKQSKDNKLP